MEKTVLDAALSQGLWATLFVFLLLTVIGLVKWILQKFEEREKATQAENNEREKRYIETIDSLASGLTENAAGLKEVKSCVEEARKDIDETKRLMGRVLDRLPAKGE